jgi:hypothetical protein
MTFIKIALAEQWQEAGPCGLKGEWDEKLMRMRVKNFSEEVFLVYEVNYAGSGEEHRVKKETSAHCPKTSSL